MQARSIILDMAIPESCPGDLCRCASRARLTVQRQAPARSNEAHIVSKEHHEDPGHHPTLRLTLSSTLYKRVGGCLTIMSRSSCVRARDHGSSVVRPPSSWRGVGVADVQDRGLVSSERGTGAPQR